MRLSYNVTEESRFAKEVLSLERWRRLDYTKNIPEYGC